MTDLIQSVWAFIVIGGGAWRLVRWLVGRSDAEPGAVERGWRGQVLPLLEPPVMVFLVIPVTFIVCCVVAGSA